MEIVHPTSLHSVRQGISPHFEIDRGGVVGVAKMGHWGTKMPPSDGDVVRLEWETRAARNGAAGRELGKAETAILRRLPPSSLSWPE